MKLISNIKKLSAAAAIFLATSLSAHADLDEVIDAYQARGWYIHDVTTGYLVEGEVAEVTVFLEAGDRMVVRGEGADAVRDLDVAVILPNGDLLKKDVDADATPYVPFTVPVSGLYTVQIKIHSLFAGFSAAEVGLILAER